MIESKLDPNRGYKRVRDEITLENVKLIWRNFAGEKKQYNEAGKRNFAIALDEDLALELYDVGWPVKDNVSKVNDPTHAADEVLYHLPVTVKMDGKRPARVFIVAPAKNPKPDAPKNVKTLITPETAMVVDWARFDLVDLKLSPYNYDFNNRKGVTAYLVSMFGFLHVDDLEQKYADIPEEEQAAIEAGDDVIDVEGSEWVEDEEDEDEIIRRRAIEA
jgi:hypothetical protein